MSQLILLLTGVKVNTSQNISISMVHTQMGHIMYYLLRLLLKEFSEEDLKNRFLFRLWDQVRNAVMTVMQAVTIEVFCSWYEVSSKRTSYLI